MVDYEHEPVSVAGKRAVVIGGTSGIGRGIATAFAADGARVVPTSRSESRVEVTADELADLGAETVRATCDVTDRESLVALRDRVVDEFGGVDILVNSPSAIARKSLVEVTDEEWDRVFDVQLDGPRRATQVFADALTRGGVGSIINISSASSVTAIDELAAYSAAKAGIDALTRVSARELAPAVRVNAIRPGFIVTEQTRGTYAPGTDRYEAVTERTYEDRIGEPVDIGGAAIYLASDASRYVRGEILTVDCGFIQSAL
ncbi:SDR family NAD(P)-dependent oxidoreductase [Natronorarus salvus]|uniref:SDR family NAD(P)-dependent oxidoreductase n=1 Tax=Natronorarus salvus TaxID=3117733 RepID=UPI002F26A27A